MASQGMDRLLKKLETNVAPKTVDQLWQAELSSWLGALDGLFVDIERWLEPFVDKDFVTLERLDTEIVEDATGAYRAPVIEARFRTDPPRVVRVEPRALRVTDVMQSGGTRIVGAKGRVDLVCGIVTIVLLRSAKDGWWVVRQMPAAPKEDLSEETFASAIEELIGL